MSTSRKARPRRTRCGRRAVKPFSKWPLLLRDDLPVGKFIDTAKRALADVGITLEVTMEGLSVSPTEATGSLH